MKCILLVGFRDIKDEANTHNIRVFGEGHVPSR